VIHTKAVDVLKLLRLPTMSALLRQKRLRWVGHALRRDDSDLSKKREHFRMMTEARIL